MQPTTAQWEQLRQAVADDDSETFAKLVFAIVRQRERERRAAAEMAKPASPWIPDR